MHSNRYTFIYAVVFTTILAVVLAVTATSLAPRQAANEARAKKQAILGSVMEVNNETLETDYEKYIQELVIKNDGNEVAEAAAFDIDITKESKKAEDERLLPIYVFENGGEKKYIVPMQGSGLWGPISAYLAIEDDLNTISGVVFDHVSETPGLGAEITTDVFQGQYAGKKLFDGTGGFTSIKVLKGTGNDVTGKPHEVDGLAGATITANGVTDMFSDELRYYTAFFKKLAS
ncbi:MAG: NADH:ubiquinone reductase (Na(+)-transporting) subunit C [Rhodothermaceae bacterium]|nr:NADH:ubiquinone reductase (Na(+)-transporting) subunit C [Rhodothermaceae bacterium]